MLHFMCCIYFNHFAILQLLESETEWKAYGVWEGDSAPTFDHEFHLPTKSASVIGDNRVVNAIETQQKQVIVPWLFLK